MEARKNFPLFFFGIYRIAKSKFYGEEYNPIYLNGLENKL
jgi:hypothetical protein